MCYKYALLSKASPGNKIGKKLKIKFTETLHNANYRNAFR